MSDPMQEVGRAIADTIADLKSRPQVKMWAITYSQRPTFYLHPDIHGILSEKAAIKIGADVLGLVTLAPHVLSEALMRGHISAVLVDIDA